MENKKISPIGECWDDVEKEYFTPEEIAESDVRVAIIGELIKARQEKGVSQKQLAEMTGVKQPAIARIERGTVSPSINTVVRMLVPLGMTLAVVPLQAAEQ